MGGSHHGIQPPDDTEDGMNDHEDVYKWFQRKFESKSSTVQDAKGRVQQCEFISFLTSEVKNAIKTNGGQSKKIVFATLTLGFDSYVEPLKLYLQNFREALKGEKGIWGRVTATHGLSEALRGGIYQPVTSWLNNAEDQQQSLTVHTMSYQQTSGVQQMHFSGSEKT
ncbi:hypothetical protein GH733_017242, partial [Mirounga leonina]